MTKTKRTIGGNTWKNPSVQVTGKLFNGVPSSAVMRAAKKAEKFALDTTKSRSRVDTGIMKDSWFTRLETSTKGVSLTVQNTVFYTKYQEYGTRNIKPMYAASTAVPQAVQMFKTELQKELQTELGGTIERIERGTAEVLSKFFRGVGKS